jgi:hypothetical protein
MGDTLFFLGLCHPWDDAGLGERRSRFAGPFGMTNGTLPTPMLLLSYVLPIPVSSVMLSLANSDVLQEYPRSGHASRFGESRAFPTRE